MNCRIKPMSDGSKGDPYVAEGRVDKVCREWLVKEDGVLAYKLQNEEIEQHYEGNRQKSKIGRIDLHKAKSLQDEDRRVAYEEALLRQQQEDERIALEMQQKLIEEQRMLERIRMEDEKLAQKLFHKEKERALRKRMEKEIQRVEKLVQQRAPEEYQDVARTLDSLKLNEDHFRDVDLSEFCRKPPPGLSSEEMKEFLAEQDAEIAEFLQRQETKTKDVREKQSLIEAHDFEIARILQEEEKARLKRIREKARQKNMRKSSSQDALGTENATPEASAEGSCVPEKAMSADGTLNGSRRALPPIPTYNIFSDIDPTCKKEGGEVTSPANSGVYFAQVYQTSYDSPPSSPTSSLQRKTLSSDTYPGASFLPVQGQKRSPPSEKSKSKKNKDGCKTQ